MERFYGVHGTFYDDNHSTMTKLFICRNCLCVYCDRVQIVLVLYFLPTFHNKRQH